MFINTHAKKQFLIGFFNDKMNYVMDVDVIMNG